MNEELIKLVKNTWCDYFSGNKEIIEHALDKSTIEQYEEAMMRLETDFEFQRELGIGI